MNTVTPTQHDIYVLVKAFVVSVTGLDPSLVIQGIPNRGAMPPASPGFVAMAITRGKQLRTPQDTYDLTDPNPTSLDIEQGTELRLQLDLYGAAAGDWAVIFQTLLRDETGCIALAGADPRNPIVQPLYASDFEWVPLDDSEQQYENRYMIEAILQYNPTTTVPMQFSNALDITLIDVDVTFPP